MTPQTTPTAPDAAVIISIKSSARIKKHEVKARMAQLALQIRILELLDHMKAELDRQKIHVSVHHLLP